MLLARLTSSSWPAMTFTALMSIVLLLHYDIPAFDLFTYLVYLAAGISLPGVLAWRLLLRSLHVGDEDPPTWFEDLSLGTIFGFGLQLPVFLFGVWSCLPLLIVVLPIAAVAVSFTRLGRETWTLPTGRLHVGTAWALSLTALYGLGWLGRNAFALRSLDLPSNRPPSI